MGRMVDVDQLAPARLIAERLRWKRVQLVHYYWRSDPNFPEPVYSLTKEIGGLRLWYWPDIEAWARNRGKWPLPDEVEVLQEAESVTADG